MIDVEAVDERLRALRDYVQQLRPYQEWTLQALTEQPITYNGVLHLLQLSIQAIMDISTHIHVALDLPRAANYSKSSSRLETLMSCQKHSPHAYKKCPAFVTSWFTVI
jgi:uncharacterized protein YutE (UPF0331/DUF86 family)